MNYVLRLKKYILPIKYNLQHGFLHKEPQVSWEYDYEIEEAIVSPIIIHYTAADKPWHLDCSHPLKKEFLKYKSMSIWHNIPLSNNSKTNKNLKYFLKEILYHLGVIDRPLKYTLYKDISPLV